MNVEAYLKKTYGKFKKLKNGNYYVKTKDNTVIYVPKNFSSSTKVCAFIPGKGGGGSQKLKTKMESSNPGDYLTIISPTANDSTKVLDQANKIVTDNGSKVDGVVVYGFSLGARQTMVTMNNYLKKHPEQADNSTIVMTDGWLRGYVNRTDLNILKDKKVQILYISTKDNVMEDKKSKKVRTLLAQLTEAGFNAVGVESYDYGHGGVNNDAISNGFIDFIFGDTKKIGNKNVNTSKKGYEPNYEFIIYDPVTKKYKLIFSMKKNTSYSALEFLKMQYKNIKGDVIQSNNPYLQEKLTSINKAIASLSDISFKLTVSSTTSVPQMEPGLIDTLNNSIQTLCAKMNSDMVEFGRVGDKFKELDLELEEQSQTLMADFKKPTETTELNIPKNKLTAREFNLEQLLSDYKNYENATKNKTLKADDEQNTSMTKVG